jgi:nucleoside-diphosphate-sugar epimerase
MKIFVAGAAGVVGNRLVPLLVRNGHDVTAMTRSSRKADWARSVGAKHVAADGLDREAVRRAVAAARPDVIVHQMTALAGSSNLKAFDTYFALTNRLRTEGTDHLLDAARENGVRRVIAQSYGNWNYERTGTALKTEADQLDPRPAARQRQSLAAIRYVEAAVTGAAGIEGVALRYGNFYGPNTGFAPDGDITAAVRKGLLPLVGNGAGVWSFIHVDDAATATMAAITRRPGVYNIADDDPAPVRVWLPEFARIIGARAPRQVPAWLGRLFVGEVGVSMMTRIRGASNRKAKADLGWQPRYASWRDGFAHEFAETPTTGASQRRVAEHA